MDNLESVAPSPNISLAEMEANIPSEHDEPAPVKETPEPQPEKATEQQPQEQPKQMDASQYEALQREIIAMKRELGQARKLQAEFAELRKSQNKPTPNPQDSLDPETKTRVVDLIKSVVGSEYGENLSAVQEIREAMQEQQELSGFLEDVKAAAGDNLKALAPHISNLLTEAKKAADLGNEQAAKWLAKVKIAPEVAVYDAKELYAKSAEAKAAEARAAQEAKASKAALTLKPGAKPVPQSQNQDPRKMSLKELEDLIPDETQV